MKPVILLFALQAGSVALSGSLDPPELCTGEDRLCSTLKPYLKGQPIDGSISEQLTLFENGVVEASSRTDQAVNFDKEGAWFLYQALCDACRGVPEPEVLGGAFALLSKTELPAEIGTALEEFALSSPSSPTLRGYAVALLRTLTPERKSWLLPLLNCEQDRVVLREVFLALGSSGWPPGTVVHLTLLATQDDNYHAHRGANLVLASGAVESADVAREAAVLFVISRFGCDPGVLEDVLSNPKAVDLRLSAERFCSAVETNKSHNRNKH